MQLEPDWPALAMERGSLFGVRDTLGYNPVQLPRYWNYLRARTQLPIFYNAAVIDLPTAQDVRLLGARHLVVPTGVPSPLPGEVVEQAQGYDLVEIAGWQPRVSVVPAWEVVANEADALRAVLEPTFDPALLAVLESDPEIEPVPRAAPGSAASTEPTPESVRIEADAEAPSIVVVRTSFDEGWTATVDGEPAQVLPADGFLLGIPVGPGTHEIALTYRDEAITRGLVLGGVVWGALGLAFAGTLVSERRQRRDRVSQPAPTRAAGPSGGDAGR